MAGLDPTIQTSGGTGRAAEGLDVYMEEKQDDYTVSDGVNPDVAVDGQTVALGRLMGGSPSLIWARPTIC